MNLQATMSQTIPFRFGKFRARQLSNLKSVLIGQGELTLTNPAEVIAALTLTGTHREQVSQKLAAIRVWLATPEGQAYVAALPEGSSQWRAGSGRNCRPCDTAWGNTSTQTVSA
jgi:hypothetical protein